MLRHFVELSEHLNANFPPFNISFQSDGVNSKRDGVEILEMARISVRARAVDMLGRQQIAGVPTAIHELFKNSHDAYAKNVEVDYFRVDQTFVLRDDGYGMTREDFESRWLTLGTEGKVDANIESTPDYLDEDTPRRVILGEKGIGRLAIAAIGRQVLILSRAKRKDALQDLVVSFVHWGLFELPGIDLNKIIIPVTVVPGGSLPSESIVRKLTRQIADNVRELADDIASEDAAAILNELDSFSIDPKQVDSSFKRLSLRGNGRGTHFYIMPTDPIIEGDIDDIGSDEIAGPLQKMLLGFSNTMIPDRPPSVIRASFRDHKKDGRVVELIGGQEFFTHEEFQSADHHFDGEVDEFGQFRGTVSIYGLEPEPCTFEWPAGQGKKTACGSFKFKFAYVHGKRTDSLLSPEDHGRIEAKLNKIGGLYIYRDGIRILPYGNSDYDFLSIERRRSKSAHDWFFSYRRIFGAIELTYAHNGNLKEKAGREGFIANTAYRQLRSIMEHIFMQLAKTFFRKEANRGGDFNRLKAEMEHHAILLRNREKRVKYRKAEFETSLGMFFENVENGKPSGEATKIEAMVKQRLLSIEKLSKSEDVVGELMKLESTANDKVVKLRSEFTIKKARGFSMSKKIRASWYAYQDELVKLENDIFSPLSIGVDTAITKVAGKETINLDRRKRARKAIDDTQYSSLKMTKAAGMGALSEAKKLVEAVRGEAKVRIVDVTEVIEKALAEFATVDTTNMTDKQIRKKQNDLQLEIVTVAEQETNRIEAVISQIHSMIEAMNAGDSLSDETSALEAEYIGLREQLDLFAELAQVGTALGIVQHEFGSTIRSVRENIERLAEWASLDEELAEVYSGIRASFEHLDGYLGFFAPLNKRLQRHRIPIIGEEIRRYLQHVFGDRLERHHIHMVGTHEFDRKIIEGYPSTYYPAFVNLIDNAIYWILSRQQSDRLITLNSDDEGFTITNNGPGIPLEIKDWIFEFANTEKDGGRGMGLYISKETLRRDGADIILENPGKDNNPTFRIILPQEERNAI